MYSRPLRTIRLSACVIGLCELATAPARAANPTLPAAFGATPVQNAVFNAVVNTCLTLDVLGATNPNTGAPVAALTTQQQDLHDQCHGVASAALSAGAAAAPVLGAVQQLSGNQYSSQGSLATRAVSGQFTNISGRLSVLRLGASAAPGQLISLNNAGVNGASQADGFAPALALPLSLSPQQPQGSLLNTAFMSNSSAAAEHTDMAGGGTGGGAMQNPWGVYVQGSYNSGHHDSTVNEDPFNFHASSVTAGLDYNFGTAVLGVSVGYDDYNAGFRTQGFDVSGGSVQVKSTSGSIYGAWFNQSWNFNGIATYGRLQTNLARVVTYDVTYNQNTIPNPLFSNECPTAATCTVATARTLKGDPNGSAFAVGATAGYQTRAGILDIAPSLSVNYRRASINSFTETDANPPPGGDGLALSVDDQAVDSFRTILGLDLSTPVSTSFGVVTPLVRMEWDHEFKTGVRFINAHYAATNGIGTGCLSCFALPTDGATANYGIAGAGLSVLLAHRVQAFVYDEVLFGESHYSSNSVAIGVRGQF